MLQGGTDRTIEFIPWEEHRRPAFGVLAGGTP